MSDVLLIGLIGFALGASAVGLWFWRRLSAGKRHVFKVMRPSK